MEIPKRLAPLIEECIEDGVFPGCAIGFWKKGQGPQFCTWGRTTYEETSTPVTTTTLFDLASLTKPLVSTILTLFLLHEERISLNSTLEEVLDTDDCTPDKASIEIIHLLHHQSGLPAWLPLFETDRGEEAFLRSILRAPLLNRPGDHTEYSDLGFIILGTVIERLLGMPLPELFRERVVLPLGINKEWLTLRPGHGENIAPTQLCPYRGGLIKGVVHDLNAWALGGYGGHAGLFSNCEALMEYLIGLHLAITGKGPKDWAINHLLKDLFGRFKKGPFRLGFDTPSPQNSQAGTLFSANTIGHLGYTGTSFWMDLERDIIVVLLTNRTFPDDSPRTREKIKAVRPRVHDIIVTELPY